MDTDAWIHNEKFFAKLMSFVRNYGANQVEGVFTRESTLFYGIIEQVRNNLIRCLLAGSLRCEKRRSRDGDLQLFLL